MTSPAAAGGSGDSQDPGEAAAIARVILLGWGRRYLSVALGVVAFLTFVVLAPSRSPVTTPFAVPVADAGAPTATTSTTSTAPTSTTTPATAPPPIDTIPPGTVAPPVAGATTTTTTTAPTPPPTDPSPPTTPPCEQMLPGLPPLLPPTCV